MSNLEVVKGILVNNLEFDRIDMLIPYLEDEYGFDDINFMIVTESRSFTMINEYLKDNKVDSKLVLEKVRACL